MTEGIQINEGGIRAAIAAVRNASPAPQGELQTPAAVPAPETPTNQVPVEAAPVEQVEAQPQTQTDLPVQDAPVDDFELDLSKNPLEEVPTEAPTPERVMSRREADEEFRELLKSNPRFRRIYDNHAEMARVSAPPEEGGIGFKPEVEQIKQWHSSHANLDDMVLDFTSGSPQAAAKFVSHWFDANEGYQNSTQVAAAIPEVLAQVNPEAYQAVGNHYGSAIINQLTQLASAPGRTPEDIARLNDAALLLSHVTGVKPTQRQQAAPPPANDEVAALRAEVQRLKYGTQQQTQGNIRESFTRNLDHVLEADADTALSSLKEAADPVVYKALRADMIREMRQVAISNPAIRQELDNNLKRMIRSGQVGDMSGVVRLWRQGYRDPLPQIRSQYLKAAGFSVTRPADEARAVMQQAQQKTAPTQGTAPQTSTSIQPRQPGESMRDFVGRTLHARRAG
jgi:hypothetical protein